VSDDGRRRATWIGLGLVVLAAVVYAPVRGHDFVSFDDPSYVRANPGVAGGLTWRAVGWAFTTGHAGNWHPLTWISHALDVSLFGMDAGLHHLTSVAFHAANTLLLFDLLRRLTGAVGRSAFVAALFAVHPLHVESVAWVSERKDVLSTLFWLLTTRAYVAYARAPTARRYALVVLAFVAGLLSKPMLVTLPFTLLLLDWWPLARTKEPGAWRRLVAEKVPLLLLAAASCVVTFFVQRTAGAVANVELYSVASRVANVPIAYVLYVRNMLWPTGLSPLYVHSRSVPVLESALAAAALAGVTFLALRHAARRPWFAVGWLWYLGTLVPVIGLVQVGAQSMADRYTYVPLIGLFVVVAWGAVDLLDWERRRGVLLPAAAAAATLACAVLARRQVGVWKDSEVLWRHAVDVSTDKSAALNNLGDYLCHVGRIDEAIAQFREMVRLRPDSAEAHNNLGYALRSKGELDLAMAEYHEAIRLHPELPHAYDNLGLALRDQGRLDEAAAQFREAIARKSDFAAARHNLAVVLAEQGRLDDAILEISEAVRLSPDDVPTRCDLGRMLERRGDVAGAVREFEAAIRRNPDAAEAHHNLAVLLAGQGRLDDAIREIREVIRISPGDAASHCDLGLMLERRGDVPGAVRALETAVRLDPGEAAARAALERLTGRR
jgi:Flp pilus assembly protein TadD